MPQPLIELGGSLDAPLLHLAPANGFPPQCYAPMLDGLSGYRAFCLPPRALWGDQQPPDGYRSWRESADDLLAGFDAHGMEDITLVGHSLGGVVSMLAVLMQPWRFRALVMLDPVMLPQQMLDVFDWAWQTDNMHMNPLVQGALRRRNQFDSLQDAFDRFRAKDVFADWTDDALWLYARHGTRARDDGQGIELVWTREWEAHYFATVYRQIWETLPKVDGLTRTLLVHPQGSETFPDSVVADARAALPSADFVDLAGQGHLFPLAEPRMTARLVGDWLAEREAP